MSRLLSCRHNLPRHSYFVSIQFANLQCLSLQGVSIESSGADHLGPTTPLRRGPFTTCPSKPTTMLIVSESAHPNRPVLGLCAAALRPRPSRVVLWVPFERPELFQAHLLHRPIEEQTVDSAVMAVDTNTLRSDVRRCQNPGGNGIACWWRRLLAILIDVNPHTVQKNRHSGCVFDQASHPQETVASHHAWIRSVTPP